MLIRHETTVHLQNLVLVAFDFQLFPHARPVGTIQGILVKPFDVEA